MNIDDKIMKQAILAAKEGMLQKKGGPFGACLVKDGVIISTAHNTVLSDQNPLKHAEMNAIELACQKLNTHVLEGCVLYTTSEPCPMCCGAIHWARIDKVYIGSTCTTAKEFGFDDAYFYDELRKEPEHREIEHTFLSYDTDVKEIFQLWKKENGEIY